jgi:hypothetical protein
MENLPAFPLLAVAPLAKVLRVDEQHLVPLLDVRIVAGGAGVVGDRAVDGVLARGGGGADGVAVAAVTGFALCVAKPHLSLLDYVANPAAAVPYRVMELSVKLPGVAFPQMGVVAENALRRGLDRQFAVGILKPGVCRSMALAANLSTEFRSRLVRIMAGDAVA